GRDSFGRQLNAPAQPRTAQSKIAATKPSSPLPLANPCGKEAGSHHAGKSDMRGLVTFILIAGIGGGLFVWQKQHEQKVASSESSAATQAVESKPVLTPAPRGQASEHNWMKRALDRAADVRDQARTQTKEAQDP